MSSAEKRRSRSSAAAAASAGSPAKAKAKLHKLWAPFRGYEFRSSVDCFEFTELHQALLDATTAAKALEAVEGMLAYSMEPNTTAHVLNFVVRTPDILDTVASIARRFPHTHAPLAAVIHTFSFVKDREGALVVQLCKSLAFRKVLRAAPGNDTFLAALLSILVAIKGAPEAFVTFGGDAILVDVVVPKSGNEALRAVIAASLLACISHTTPKDEAQRQRLFELSIMLLRECTGYAILAAAREVPDSVPGLLKILKIACDPSGAEKCAVRPQPMPEAAQTVLIRITSVTLVTPVFAALVTPLLKVLYSLNLCKELFDATDVGDMLRAMITPSPEALEQSPATRLMSLYVCAKMVQAGMKRKEIAILAAGRLLAVVPPNTTRQLAEYPTIVDDVELVASMDPGMASVSQLAAPLDPSTPDERAVALQLLLATLRHPDTATAIDATLTSDRIEPHFRADLTDQAAPPALRHRWICFVHVYTHGLSLNFSSLFVPLSKHIARGLITKEDFAGITKWEPRPELDAALVEHILAVREQQVTVTGAEVDAREEVIEAASTERQDLVDRYESRLAELRADPTFIAWLKLRSDAIQDHTLVCEARARSLADLATEARARSQQQEQHSRSESERQVAAMKAAHAQELAGIVWDPDELASKQSALSAKVNRVLRAAEKNVSNIVAVGSWRADLLACMSRTIGSHNDDQLQHINQLVVEKEEERVRGEGLLSTEAWWSANQQSILLREREARTEIEEWFHSAPFDPKLASPETSGAALGCVPPSVVEGLGSPLEASASGRKSPKGGSLNRAPSMANLSTNGPMSSLLTLVNPYRTPTPSASTQISPQPGSNPSSPPLSRSRSQTAHALRASTSSGGAPHISPSALAGSGFAQRMKRAKATTIARAHISHFENPLGRLELAAAELANRCFAEFDAGLAYLANFERSARQRFLRPCNAILPAAPATSVSDPLQRSGLMLSTSISLDRSRDLGAMAPFTDWGAAEDRAVHDALGSPRTIHVPELASSAPAAAAATNANTSTDSAPGAAVPSVTAITATNAKESTKPPPPLPATEHSSGPAAAAARPASSPMSLSVTDGMCDSTSRRSSDAHHPPMQRKITASPSQTMGTGNGNPLMPHNNSSVTSLESRETAAADAGMPGAARLLRLAAAPPTKALGALEATHGTSFEKVLGLELQWRCHIAMQAEAARRKAVMTRAHFAWWHLVLAAAESKNRIALGTSEAQWWAYIAKQRGVVPKSPVVAQTKASPKVATPSSASDVVSPPGTASTSTMPMTSSAVAYQSLPASAHAAAAAADAGIPEAQANTMIKQLKSRVKRLFAQHEEALGAQRAEFQHTANRINATDAEADGRVRVEESEEQWWAFVAAEARAALQKDGPFFGILEAERSGRGQVSLEEKIAIYQITADRPRGKRYRPPRDEPMKEEKVRVEGSLMNRIRLWQREIGPSNISPYGEIVDDGPTAVLGYTTTTAAANNSGTPPAQQCPGVSARGSTTSPGGAVDLDSLAAMRRTMSVAQKSGPAAHGSGSTAGGIDASVGGQLVLSGNTENRPGVDSTTPTQTTPSGVAIAAPPPAAAAATAGRPVAVANGGGYNNEAVASNASNRGSASPGSGMPSPKTPGAGEFTATPTPTGAVGQQQHHQSIFGAGNTLSPSPAMQPSSYPRRTSSSGNNVSATSLPGLDAPIFSVMNANSLMTSTASSVGVLRDAGLSVTASERYATVSNTGLPEANHVTVDPASSVMAEAINRYVAALDAHTRLRNDNNDARRQLQADAHRFVLTMGV